MTTKNTGYLLTGLGIAGIVISLLMDILGIGKAGIQAAQLLGIQIGAIVAAAGLGFIFTKQKVEIDLVNVARTSFEWLLDLPAIVWIIVGFLGAYVLLFIFPMFFNPEHRLQYFYRYLPDKYPIGLDLSTITESIRAWLINGQGPYQNQEIFYPPLHHILIAPILLFNYPKNYYLLVAIILVSFSILTFLIPVSVGERRNFSIPVFFFVTALFSYGFQFELERGQFNVITFTLCILSIYLFYFHKSFRYLAYLFFSFSVHLRLYPAIFIVMFINDWTVWKQNLKRLFGILVLNLMLLFVLGYSQLIMFFQALTQKLGPSWTWVGNHSLTSFVYNLTNSGFGLFDQGTLTWLKEHSTFITVTLLAYFVICFVFVVLKDFLKKKRGLNPDLLLICTVGALIIPSVSHDYKLALLACPLTIALSNRTVASSTWRKGLSALLITLASIAYSITLFPFKYKPQYLENSFPLLFVILSAITLLSFVAGPHYLGADISERERA